MRRTLCTPCRRLFSGKRGDHRKRERENSHHIMFIGFTNNRARELQTNTHSNIAHFNINIYDDF